MKIYLLKKELSNEKRIILILDNYSAHKSKIAKKFAKFLNIKLIFLPAHSPMIKPNRIGMESYEEKNLINRLQMHGKTN